jgi:hypothetical protein
MNDGSDLAALVASKNQGVLDRCLEGDLRRDFQRFMSKRYRQTGRAGDRDVDDAFSFVLSGRTIVVRAPNRLEGADDSSLGGFCGEPQAPGSQKVPLRGILRVRDGITVALDTGEDFVSGGTS